MRTLFILVIVIRNFQKQFHLLFKAVQLKSKNKQNHI